MDQRAGADCGPQGRTGPSSATREATSRPGYVTALEIAPPAPGASAPLEATASDGGVNFSVFSKEASRIELLLFGHADATEPSHVIPLDPQAHRTYHYWHVCMPGPVRSMATGQRGRMRRDRGLRFDADKLLLDVYGRAVAVPRA
jgi:isoamylase